MRIGQGSKRTRRLQIPVALALAVWASASLSSPHAPAARADDRASALWDRVSPEITALVLAAQAANGSGQEQAVRMGAAFKRLEQVLEEGTSRESGGRRTFVLSYGLMALVGANDDGHYDKLIRCTMRRLKAAQSVPTPGASESEASVGGTGYERAASPDLYHTSLALEALRQAGMPVRDPYVQRAVRFISSCQSLPEKGHPTGKPEAVLHGGFSIVPRTQGASKEDGKPDESLRPCGSLTCAGLKSLILCGVPKEDRRVEAALDWIRRNCTLAANPGMAIPRGRLYDYYLCLAGAMTALGEDTIVGAGHIRHNWRRELGLVLEAEQQPDGSWLNLEEADALSEIHPLATTSLAVMTLRRIKGAGNKRPVNQYMASALRWE